MPPHPAFGRSSPERKRIQTAQKKARWPSAGQRAFEECFLFAGTGGTTTAFAFAFTALSSTLTSFAAPCDPRLLRGDCGRSSPSNEGRPCGAPPRPPKPPRPLARCRLGFRRPGEARKQFSVGQFAVIVFVQLLERGGAALISSVEISPLPSASSAAMIRKHPHESTGTTRRASETAGTTGPAGGTIRSPLPPLPPACGRRDRSPRLLRSPPRGCARLGAFAI